MTKLRLNMQSIDFLGDIFKLVDTLGENILSLDYIEIEETKDEKIKFKFEFEMNKV